jgi:hypothetical protein
VATREFTRFTIEEVNAGRADGWTFASGWYAFQNSAWAWYWRPAAEEK